MKPETKEKLNIVVKKILESQSGEDGLYVAEYMDPAGGETVYSGFDFLVDYDERMEDLVWHLENYGHCIYYKTKEGMKILWENE